MSKQPPPAPTASAVGPCPTLLQISTTPRNWKLTQHHRTTRPPPQCWGWSGGAMVLGKLPVPGRPTIWMIVGQGPIALAVGAGGGCLDIFTLFYLLSPLSPSLWGTARYSWLVGCFGFNGPLRQHFSLYRAVSQREGERGEKGQRRVKMSKQPPPAPTASAIGPCPTVIKIVGRPGTGSLPSTIAPPNHPTILSQRAAKPKTTNQPPVLPLLVSNSFLFYYFSKHFCMRYIYFFSNFLYTPYLSKC